MLQHCVSRWNVYIWLLCSDADVQQYRTTLAETTPKLVRRNASLLNPSVLENKVQSKIHKMWVWDYHSSDDEDSSFTAKWHWVVGCIIPDVSKDCGASVFTVEKSEKSAWCLRHTTRPTTWKRAHLKDRWENGEHEEWHLAHNFASATCDVLQLSWRQFKSSGISHHGNRPNSQLIYVLPFAQLERYNSLRHNTMGN